MALRKKGSLVKPTVTKKQLNKKPVIKSKKTTNKTVDNKQLTIIKQIQKLLKELE